MEQQHDLSYRIIGCAIKVHRALGPGLLEAAYQRCIMREFQLEGIPAVTEVPICLEYRGEEIDCSFRADFIVDNQILLELKSVDKLAPIHTAQVITYLKLTHLKVGLLINFNVELLKEDGIKRIVN